MNLILASASPRRQDLLTSAGLKFQCKSPDIDEVKRPEESPISYAERNALEKAREVFQNPPKTESEGPLMVLAADTIVKLGEVCLEKPGTDQEAIAMLRSLSHRSHEVVTAYALIRAEAQDPIVGHEITHVEFRNLGNAEIERYVATGEPFDKAGGYGIQGGAAGFVNKINGSYTNVVGLPLAQILPLLSQ